MSAAPDPIVPATAGTQSYRCEACGLSSWIPAYAGMNGEEHSFALTWRAVR